MATKDQPKVCISLDVNERNAESLVKLVNSLEKLPHIEKPVIQKKVSGSSCFMFRAKLLRRSRLPHHLHSISGTFLRKKGLPSRKSFFLLLTRFVQHQFQQSSPK